jgi:endonuclease-8
VASWVRMPEGDTIFRTATTLRQWMLGRAITAARSTAPIPVAALVGDTVATIEARAKHLLIRFESGRVLHTHMRMTGSWHVYSAGDRWRKPVSQARVVLEAGHRLAVCFNAPVVELLAPGGERAHPALAKLGPDVLVEPLDLPSVLQRAATRAPETEIGDLLLDQQVVSGIGNIYRCEALFLNQVHPRRRASLVNLVPLVETAARLMKLSARRDATPPRDTPWVYGRSGRPCRRCGTRIASARVGTQGRTAYWCPRCQPEP